MIEPLQSTDPESVGGYRLLRRLGAGGMGVVYLGLRANEHAAIKVIRPELIGVSEFRLRFRREVELAKRVRSQYVAQVLLADVDGAVPFVAHRFVEGESLAEHVREHGPLGEPQLISFAQAMTEALLAIHSADVIHRDLTPNNVMLSPDGPVIVDFGIARADDSTVLTSTGAAIGTPAWMAPEQLRGRASTTATDIWSWGTLVAFAASGVPPFGGDRPEAVMYRVVNEEPRLFSIPNLLTHLVRSALSRTEAARPSASQLAHELLGTNDLSEAHVVTRTFVGQAWDVVKRDQLPVLPRNTIRLPGPPQGFWRRLSIDKKVLVALALVGAVLIGGALYTNGVIQRGRDNATSASPSDSADTVPASPERTEVATTSPVIAVGAGSEPPLVQPSDDEPRFNDQTGGCDPYPQPSLDGSYQVSAPSSDGERPDVTPGEVAEIGLRDKLGYEDGPSDPTFVKARVIAPDGTSVSATGNLFDSEWLFLNFPNDFPGAERVYAAGTYTVVWTQALQGGFLACHGFAAG